MTLAVIVLDPIPSYRQGLLAALADAGLATDEPDDPLHWARQPPPRAAVMTVRSPCQWEEFRRLRAASDHLVATALVAESTPEAFGDALRAGADGAAVWDWPPTRIIAVLRAAADGQALLPGKVAAALAAAARVGPSPDWITPDEIQWLQILAQGATVADLADQVGYAERTMYRLLHGLYGRMNVDNRTEAILRASQWSLFSQS